MIEKNSIRQVQMRTDEFYMQRALELAREGEGRTTPNPPVGAIIVRRDKIIGQGFHQRAGLPHAEVNAIADARNNGERIKGSTIYITLEPCCHFGKTPPCTEAIKEAGIKRVVFSSYDPDPRNNGKSVKILQDAGIEVKTGVLRNETEYLLKPFRTLIEKGRSFVVVKYASTIDGRIAARTGDSKWISCSESLELAHIFRDRYDAILIGSGTLTKDDPRLTVRHTRGRNPVRFVMSGINEMPSSRKIFTDNSARTIVITKSQKPFGDADIPEGVEIWHWQSKGEYVSIEEVAIRAAKEGITSIMIEGGRGIITAALEDGVVDRIHTVIAPSILGEGISAVGDLRRKSISDALKFDFVDVKKIGRDVLLTSEPMERE